MFIMIVVVIVVILTVVIVVILTVVIVVILTVVIVVVLTVVIMVILTVVIVIIFHLGERKRVRKVLSMNFRRSHIAHCKNCAIIWPLRKEFAEFCNQHPLVI